MALHCTLVLLTMRLELINVDDETLGLMARQHLQRPGDGGTNDSPRHRRCWLQRQAWLLG